jgi:hypothetical protein
LEKLSHLYTYTVPQYMSSLACVTCVSKSLENADLDIRNAMKGALQHWSNSNWTPASRDVRFWLVWICRLQSLVFCRWLPVFRRSVSPPSLAFAPDDSNENRWVHSISSPQRFIFLDINILSDRNKDINENECRKLKKNKTVWKCKTVPTKNKNKTRSTGDTVKNGSCNFATWG